MDQSQIQDASISELPGGYGTPDALASSALGLDTIPVVGQCLTWGWINISREALTTTAGFSHIDHAPWIGATQFANLPELDKPIENYNFYVIFPPLRSILPEGSYFRGVLAGEDVEGTLQLAFERFQVFLDGALEYNKRHGMIAFVANFIVPQQKSLGRLIKKSALPDMRAVVLKLNKFLEDYVEDQQGVYIVDHDSIASSIGKKYLLDDILLPYNHNSFMNDSLYEHDTGRIVVPRPLSDVHESKGADFFRASVREIGAMYRTIKFADQVKIVILDLDDTLWRGVMAEESLAHPVPLEGWPAGLAEALLILKQRGIILAIASKNSENFISQRWDEVFSGLLKLDDFAVKKINWTNKPENIAHILSDVSLLPSNALFIDDNPAERAAVKLAFPNIRVLGSDLYDIRRVLLWSSETQVTTITDESSRRSQMIERQVERKELERSLDRGAFLQTLQVVSEVIQIENVKDSHFQRAFELINKTNQFNTTGRRWTYAEILQFYTSGGKLFAFFTKDRFTDYGLVGVVMILKNTIEQFVMSCRVLGLDVEIRVIETILRDLNKDVIAKFVETPANIPCRNFYVRAGFVLTQDGFVRKHIDS